VRRFAHHPLPEVGSEVKLSQDAAHHYRDVLRGRVGEEVELFDGHGTSARALILAVTADAVHAQIQSRSQQATHPEWVIVLSVLKGPAMDTAIRMATEAGATRLLPVLSARSIAKGDRSERWKRIAKTAAQQCGRASIPAVPPPQSLPDALATLSGHTLYIAHPSVPDTPTPAGNCAVLIGPEGGWTDAEVQLATRHGAHPLCLGPHVFRADTAVAVAAAWLAQRR